MMNTMSKSTMLLLASLLVSGYALAAEDGHGGGRGGGGGAGCGDVFGDLIHIQRDAVTGQAILQKRWIEYPGGVYEWGYCPIALDAEGNEIPFLDLTCDPADAEAVVEVDYFGRLNGGRTKERNSRMHFNEVISSIKSADYVGEEETGRLMLGYDCEPALKGVPLCAAWSTVDSPMENMSLYTRLMKYGHFQTDPLEEDLWAHGDPATMPRYHPALGPEDYPKFAPKLRHLLPSEDEAQEYCFPGSSGAEEGTFNPACAQQEKLHGKDFVRATAFAAGAANKTGKFTVDLVQYLNRILKITIATDYTVATADTLPALIRDCGTIGDPVPGQEPEYPEDCDTYYEGASDMPFPASERFVDFDKMRYRRRQWQDEALTVLQQTDATTWSEVSGLPLMAWLSYANGPVPVKEVDIAGFVSAAMDAVRAIEFVHNYAVPEDLWSKHAEQ